MDQPGLPGLSVNYMCQGLFGHCQQNLLAVGWSHFFGRRIILTNDRGFGIEDVEDGRAYKNGEEKSHEIHADTEQKGLIAADC